jgi:hypothetical protein
MPGDHAFSWNLSPGELRPLRNPDQAIEEGSIEAGSIGVSVPLLRPRDGRPWSFRRCISDAINLHSSRVSGCKDTPAQQLFIFSQLTLPQNCPAVVAARQSLCALQHEGLGPRSKKA